MGVLPGLLACEGPGQVVHHKPTPKVKRGTHAQRIYQPRPARRCGECHANHLKGWLDSGHAHSATSQLYKQARGPAAAGCDRCHAPLQGVSGTEDRVVDEGINCEVCHGISAVRHGELGGEFDLSLADNRKFGPVCDGSEHYFHKLGCAPIFEESKFCASCHSWTRVLPTGTKLPIFTTFDEWQASGQTPTCQDCHMQQEHGALATGWRDDRLPSDHGFSALSKFDASLTLKAHVEQAGSSTKPWIVRASVTNAYAAHAFPAGLPGKALLLRVRALADDGSELARDEYLFHRVLVDDAGVERPFYEATHEREDTRLQTGETRDVELEFSARSPTQVVVELLGPSLPPIFGPEKVVTREPPKVRLSQQVFAANND